MAAAPTARPTIAASIPAMTATAGPPAADIAIADCASSAKPTLTSATATPIASKVMDTAFSFFADPRSLPTIDTMPTARPPRATTSPAITAIAPGPALASAIADCASNANPAAIASTPTPVIIKAFADAKSCFVLAPAALPADFVPSDTWNSFSASPAKPLCPTWTSALPKAFIPGATALTTCRSLNAAARPSATGTNFAIVSECSCTHPATFLMPSATFSQIAWNVSNADAWSDTPRMLAATSPRDPATALNAPEIASPTPENDPFNTSHTSRMVSTAPETLSASPCASMPSILLVMLSIASIPA